MRNRKGEFQSRASAYQDNDVFSWRGKIVTMHSLLLMRASRVPTGLGRTRMLGVADTESLVQPALDSPKRFRYRPR
ncbi:hypothetical protein HK098_005071, partial [Nowakowskiella sp. JEL0407]